MRNQKILLLGGNGYIGSHMEKQFSKKNLITLSHSRPVPDEPQFYSKIDAVINLSASKLLAEQEVSRSANYEFPKKILTRLLDHPVKWVQVGSYYELQVEHGRRDYYSSDKISFREILNDSAATHRNLSVTTLMLPHIFGGKEPEHRIIPTLSRMKFEQEVVVGSKNQYLPLLHIDDAVRAIKQAIYTQQQFCTPEPMWIGRLEDLVTKLSTTQEVFSKVLFHDHQEKFQEVELEYPEHLENFTPRITFEQFVESLGKVGDK